MGKFFKKYFQPKQTQHKCQRLCWQTVTSGNDLDHNLLRHMVGVVYFKDGINDIQ